MAKGKNKAKEFTKELGSSYLGKKWEIVPLGQGAMLGQSPSLMRRTVLCVSAVASPKGPGNCSAHLSLVPSQVPRGSCQLLPDREDVSVAPAAYP